MLQFILLQHLCHFVAHEIMALAAEWQFNGK